MNGTFYIFSLTWAKIYPDLWQFRKKKNQVILLKIWHKLGLIGIMNGSLFLVKLAWKMVFVWGQLSKHILTKNNFI